MTADLWWYLDTSLGLPEWKFITDAYESDPSCSVIFHMRFRTVLLRRLKHRHQAPERLMFSVLLLLNSISGWN